MNKVFIFLVFLLLIFYTNSCAWLQTNQDTIKKCTDMVCDIVDQLDTDIDKYVK